MADGIEYHWVICFTSSLSCGHGMTFTMRTGTDTLDVETRSEAFELLVRRVADEEGRSVDDFAVTFFTLEPNRLAGPFEAVEKILGGHHGVTFTRDRDGDLAYRTVDL